MNRWQGVLDTLIRERRSDLVGYAYVIAGDRPTAEDLVHDAIIRTFSRARRLDDVVSAEAYVKRAILTLFLNSRRSQATARAKQHLLIDRDVEAADAHAGESDTLMKAFKGLTPRERACVVLRHFEDRSTAETAEMLGLSEGSVKRYLHDAMAHLRRVLGDFEANETSVQAVPLVTRRRAR